jgi:predicted transcriptional regulator
MNIIHNQNVAFRCPNTLKEKLQAYAEEHDIRVSTVIRNACVAFLRKEMPEAYASFLTVNSANSG